MAERERERSREREQLTQILLSHAREADVSGRARRVRVSGLLCIPSLHLIRSRSQGCPLCICFSIVPLSLCFYFVWFSDNPLTIHRHPLCISYLSDICNLHLFLFFFGVGAVFIAAWYSFATRASPISYCCNVANKPRNRSEVKAFASVSNWIPLGTAASYEILDSISIWNLYLPHFGVILNLTLTKLIDFQRYVFKCLCLLSTSSGGHIYILFY